MESAHRGGTTNKPGPSPDGQDSYSFADFTLDLRAGILRRAGAEVDLRSKSFEVLAYLVQRHGQLVTRDELMQAVWPDVAVSDESLTRCIADIRKALSDDDQRLVRTVPRRGYLLSAPVAYPVIEFPSKPRAAPALPPPAPFPRRRVTLAVAILIAAVSLGWYARRIWRAPESNAPLRAVPLITLPGVSRYPSFSPDGDRVAFNWTGPDRDNPDVYVQQIGAGSPLRLTTDPADDYNPVWSPDGRWIAFLRRSGENPSRSEVRLVPPLGGPERKLADVSIPQSYFISPPYLAWSPDSGGLIVTDSPGDGQPAALFFLSLDTGEKRRMTHPQLPSIGDAHPSVSPDSRWVVFRRNASGSRSGELYRLRLRAGLAPDGEPERLPGLPPDAGYPVWSADSGEIIIGSEVAELRGNLWRLSVTSPRSAERLPFVGEDGLMPAVSPPPETRLVYVRSFQDTNIWRVDTVSPGAPASTRPTVAISSSRRDSTPQLSPDGRRVAFASDRSGVWEIWTSDPGGGNAIQMASLGTAAGAPVWSPDGERIAFQANGDVYVVPTVGGGPRNLTSHPANEGRPSFSPDGKWIYFTSARSGDRQIWRMPASGGDAQQITANGAFAGFVSPDGAYLYYNQSMDAPSPLWRAPSAGGPAVKVLEGVVFGAFAVLDRGIYYIDRAAAREGVLYLGRPSGEARLRYFDLQTGRSSTVAGDLGNTFLGLTASQDGRTVFYSRVDSSLDDLMLVENFR